VRSCRALIFDFDGVIVESEHIKSRAFAVLYGEYGDAAAAAAVAYHEANGGISRRKKIRYLHKTLLGVELAEETLETLCRRFSMLVEDEVVGCGWVPGAREVLAEQFGLRPLFVVSGTPQDELIRIVERRGLARWFAEVHGSPPEKATTIRAILARRDLDPGTVLFVGDAAADRRAAREIGVRFIGVLADAKPSRFPAGTPVISDLTQLVP
jgi:HAD superfamily hydrolase (TIGR01549 family)